MPARPSFWNERTAGLLLLAGGVGWALWHAGLFQRDLVNEGGWSLLLRFGQAAFQPDLSPALLQVTWEAMLSTLAYALYGTALSLGIGLAGGLLSSALWWRTLLPGRSVMEGGGRSREPWLLVRALLAVPRSIHEAVWGLLFVNVFGLNPLTAVLALAIPFGAITAKVFSEILDETPTGALYAALAAGAAPLPALCYTTLPQALPDLLGYTFYRLECAIRSATILGLIGAGGLGYQLLLSLQSLRYQEMWTFLYALVLLCGITDLWSSRLRWKLNVADESVVCRVGSDGRLRPEGAGWLVRLSVVAVVLLTAAAVFHVQADWSLLFAPRSWRNLWGIAGELLPPRLEPALLLALVRLSADTVAMALLAMVVAGVGGAILAFPAAVPPAGGRTKSRFLRVAPALVTRGFLLVARSVPEPVWALLALLVFFPGVLPGAIGLGLYNLGILGRLKAEAIENLDERPSNSLQAMGAPPAHVFLYGVVPRAMPRFIGYTLYRWEVCVRATLVVGLVGAGGLGRLLAEQIASFDYRGMTSTLLAFFVLTVLIDWGSAWARRVWR